MKVNYVYKEGVYSDVVIYEDQLYLSGLISQNWESGSVQLGSIEEETETVLCNMRSLLESYGSGMDKIIRVEIFLLDFTERDRMNAVYVRHFPPDKLPSRLCVGVSGLACNCKVEMTVIAYR